jgi:nondiscriminating glutamyl-tRNA synthetase
MIRFRFAPSPTGYLHIGNARVALINAWFAKRLSGQLILRLEDTDVQRSHKNYEQALQHDLSWLGIAFNESPWHNGAYGPYRQSQRSPIYHEMHQQLIKHECVYPCTCSPEQLQYIREQQRRLGQPLRYVGTCRDRSAVAPLNQSHVWRFRTPQKGEVRYHDGVMGEHIMQCQHIEDFIIQRRNGHYTFLFTNAMDDASMRVSHVVRGADHISNTAKQLLLLKALQQPFPMYYHIPLMVDRTGAKLSKRGEPITISDLRHQGFLPEAIANDIFQIDKMHAWQPLETLHTGFDCHAIGTSSACWDPEHLRYWQKQSILKLSHQHFLNWIAPLNPSPPLITLLKNNVYTLNDVHHWYACFTQPIQPVIDPTLNPNALLWALQCWKDCTQGTWLQTVRQHAAITGQALWRPIRWALTGYTEGPDISTCITVLSLDQVKKRLLNGYKILTGNDADTG